MTKKTTKRSSKAKINTSKIDESGIAIDVNASAPAEATIARAPTPEEQIQIDEILRRAGK